MISFFFLFPLCARGAFVSGAVNGPQCLKPFLAFLRCGCGPRLSAEQYMLRLPFCCCAAKNRRGKPAGSSCLPDHLALLRKRWGEVCPCREALRDSPPSAGLLPDPLASNFLLLRDGALAAPEEGEMFSLCLKERQTLLWFPAYVLGFFLGWLVFSSGSLRSDDFL